MAPTGWTGRRASPWSTRCTWTPARRTATTNTCTRALRSTSRSKFLKVGFQTHNWTDGRSLPKPDGEDFNAVQSTCNDSTHGLWMLIRFFVAGGDNAIGFAVRRPDGKIVHPYAWKATTEYEEQHAAGGYWSFCLDNQFSKFAAKLVNLYMTTFKYDEWEKFSEELQALDVTVQGWIRPSS